MELLAVSFVAYALVGAILGFPFRVLATEVRWSLWDLGVFVWPFGAWLLGFNQVIDRKGWGNLGADPLVLALIPPAYLLARVLIRERLGPGWQFVLLQTIACLLALLVAVAMPQVGGSC